jgi:hypothetical protein
MVVLISFQFVELSFQDIHLLFLGAQLLAESLAFSFQSLVLAFSFTRSGGTRRVNRSGVGFRRRNRSGVNFGRGRFVLDHRRLMCGRFGLFASRAELAERYPFVEVPELIPRYNIAPTQSVAAVRSTAAVQELVRLRWGLIPSWSKDPTIGNKLIDDISCTSATKTPSGSARGRVKKVDQNTLFASDGV